VSELHGFSKSRSPAIENTHSYQWILNKIKKEAHGKIVADGTLAC